MRRRQCLDDSNTGTECCAPAQVLPGEGQAGISARQKNAKQNSGRREHSADERGRA